MAEACVVGLDVGGTHSRAVLATVGGRTLGTGRAGGGNPTVQGPEAAIAHIVAALLAALGDMPGERVRAGVMGLAGVSTLMADPRASAMLEQAWADAGLRCAVQVVSDVTVAFAAGTPAPDGTLLVSGTGAVAARMRDRLPARFRDGYGWLLGDDGSGFWIGRQAARATLAAVDGRAPMAGLAKAVLARLLEQESDRDTEAVADASAENGTGLDAGFPGGGAGLAARAERVEGGPETNPGLRSGARLGAGCTAGQSKTPDSSPPSRVDPDARSAPPPNQAPDAAPAPATPTAPHPSAPVRPAATAPLPLAATIGEGFTRRGRRRAAELVRAVVAQPTVALAGLAPLVMAACELGDPAAARIVAEAAQVLVESLAGVGPAAGEPVVLGGSVLVSRSPVFDAVVAAVRRRWPDSPIGLAADGAAGAGWLAARRVVGAEAAARAHAAFTGAGGWFPEFAEFS